MTPKLLLAALLIGTMFSTAGCSTRIGDFSFISTGTPQYTKMTNAPVKQRITGSDSRMWFLFIPLGGKPSLEEAVDRCLDKGRGDYIERARFYSTRWSLLLISSGGYKVVGDVGNSKAGNTGQP